MTITCRWINSIDLSTLKIELFTQPKHLYEHRQQHYIIDNPFNNSLSFFRAQQMKNCESLGMQKCLRLTLSAIKEIATIFPPQNQFLQNFCRFSQRMRLIFRQLYSFYVTHSWQRLLHDPDYDNFSSNRNCNC